MKKTLSTLPILSGIFCGSLIISNILAFKTFQLLGVSLPAAVLMFPIVYIVNDILAEIYDYKTVRNIIYTGFFVNLIAVIAYKVAILLPSSAFFEGQDAFALVLGNSFRILCASFLAYLVGSFTNLKIMKNLQRKHRDKGLALRCIVSTLFGEGVDALIFITIAFLGVMPISQVFIMVISQALFKTIYECICYPITSFVIKKIKTKVSL